MWLLLFSTPMLILIIHASSNSNLDIDWWTIMHIEEILAMYFVAFLVHNFLLAPMLLYKQQTWRYVCSILILVVAFIALQSWIRPIMHEQQRHRPRAEMPMMQRYYKADNFRDDRPRPQFDDRPRPQFKEPRPFIGPAELTNTLALIFLMGMNLGVKLYYKADKDRNRMQQLEKENLKQRLNYLRYQISPHFFMNTLNNIHALVDIDPEKAKKSIVELSKLMRHILYDGDTNISPLSDEVQFLQNYIALMKMRFTGMVKVNTDFPAMTSQKGIAPLILAIFAENAFKHGVSYKSPSNIDMTLRCHNNEFILFTCKNSKRKDGAKEKDLDGGIGLRNVKNRLELIYGDRYHIDIKDTEDNYKVRLLLPLENTNTNNKQRVRL
ncbi:MAG: histidine kinase [Prevotella sp.]|nr:histidine kinase [Prevotella sp.]MDD7708706.1 histidine kinase [Prevotella sp.]MDY4151233.1 histidine kinase [Prevotella sp.]